VAEHAHQHAASAAYSQCFEVLRTFIEEDLLFDEGPPLEHDTPLLGSGILDSLSIVALLAFVEERFGVSVPDGEIAVEQLRDLRTLADWVNALMEAERL
jgi:2-hydroxymuconate-semialdehyde hydrolase